MLFNSYEFIFGFVPITALVFVLLGKNISLRLAINWLGVASIFFYAWWDWTNLFILVPSIIIDYHAGRIIYASDSRFVKRAVLTFIIVLDLLVLMYFKYRGFIAGEVNSLLGTTFPAEKVNDLPLGISFFIFQQLTFVIDCYYKSFKMGNFLDYILFVTFFPHLIAGPIVHHKQMMPQFVARKTATLSTRHFAIGLSLFVFGLSKKVLLADNLSRTVAPVFDAAAAGIGLTFWEAWSGALAYSLQLYFDFSGYSEMALGLAFMYGIKLPINFLSPYKSRSIIEFWRR